MPAASNHVVEQREELRRLVGGLQVVRLLRVTQRDFVPVVRGQRGLQRHHPASRFLRAGDTGQAEDRLHMFLVGLDHRRELFLAVVRLIRQAQAALAGVEQDPVRVSGVGGGVDVEQAAHVRAEQPAGQCHEIGGRFRGEHLGEPLPDRVQALGLHGSLVQEAVVEVPDLLLDPGGVRAAGRRVLDDLLHREFRAVPQRREGPFQGPVIRNLGALEPGAVDMLVQVILRPDAGVDIGQGDPRKWHRCSFERQAGTALLRLAGLHGGRYGGMAPSSYAPVLL